MIPRKINLLLALLLISIIGIPVITAVQQQTKVVHQQSMIVDELPVDTDEMGDIQFTKLRISPSYSHMELEPGESDEITVKVINNDNKTVSINPIFVEEPYSEYFFDEEWIDITPSSVELKPEAEIEFTIKVEIPDDEECGHYSMQIAFTDDVMPTPYDMIYKQYINAMHLNVEIWKPPVIQMQPSHIHDQVESGKDYDYEIILKNTGDVDIEIEPEFSKDRWNRYDMMMPAFTDDAIAIDAPLVVPANGTATVNIHLSVPENTKGMYEGGIDLNFDDSSFNEWERMVHLNFEVWTQPTEPFIKPFTAKTDAPLMIEITSDRYQYDMCGGGSDTNEEPSFDVTLKGPSGDYVELNLTMTGYSGSVNLGGIKCTVPWEMESSGIYDENRISYIERYNTNGAAGEWELGILPHYVEEFDYTIRIEDTD